MILYILRHADAQEHFLDAERPLSKKGIGQLDTLCNFLPIKLFSQLEVIYHSSLLRAKETAELLKFGFDLKTRVEEVSGLEPTARVEAIVPKIQSMEKDFMIVGHNPHLEQLISYLITGCPNRARPTLKKSSLACLEQIREGTPEAPVGVWTLHWLISPKIFK